MKKLFSVLVSAVLFLSLTSTALAADKTLPSDVSNVKAVAGDTRVTLTWDAATDNVKVTGYKVYSGLSSVAKGGDKYTFLAVNVGDVLKAQVKDLENGTKYFFAITAYDAAGNESANYSLEASAIPKAGLNDEKDVEAPTVVSAKAVSKSEVDVEFSEKVQLPKDKAEQAFTIENKDTIEPLDVLTARIMDEKDVEKGDLDAGKEGMVVRLGTADQKKDVNYVLTATIDVADLAGNPIISGTSDTATFKGSDLSPKPADSTGPRVVDASYIDETHVLVNFNEGVVLGLNPQENFKVGGITSCNAEQSCVTDLEVLKVSEVLLGNNTKLDITNGSVILTVDKMSAGKEYTVTVTGVLDEDGNIVDVAKNSATFKVAGESPVDTTPPPDVTKFLAKQKNKALLVLLSWILPKETDEVNQKLYVSSDKGGTYSDATLLGKDVVKYEAKDGKVDNEYWFKLTQVDAVGNESKGVLAKIKLTETGPELLGLLLVSLGLGKVFARRK